MQLWIAALSFVCLFSIGLRAEDLKPSLDNQIELESEGQPTESRAQEVDTSPVAVRSDTYTDERRPVERTIKVCKCEYNADTPYKQRRLSTGGYIDLVVGSYAP